MPPLSESEILRGKIRLARPRLAAAAGRFWGHPRVAEAFPEFLLAVHSMIRASVPLLEAAAVAAEARAHDDPVAAPLAEYYRHHAREERHHDEWLLDDLVALGRDREESLGRLPSPTVASAVGACYYWIHHVHPVALLGYLAVLEGDPPVVEELEALRQRTGLPPEAFRTLLKHAHLDPHHRDDLLALIDRLPLVPELRALVGVCAMETVGSTARLLEEILEGLQD
jgi:hypothetical protein